MLAGFTAYPIDRSLVDENADAMASTMPYATATPIKAPTAAAIRS